MNAGAPTNAILYSFRRCPYAMRARLAIQNLNEPVELREVVLRDKPQLMLDASPKATVPVLIEKSGNVIDESINIMAWALARNDPESWMKPQSASIQDMDALIQRVDNQFKPHLDRYKYANRYDEVDGEGERRRCQEFLQPLNVELEQQEFLFGSRISFADMAILPFIRQFANVDREWFDNQNWPGLRRWLEAFLSSERFSGIMNKYEQWQPGHSKVLFGGNL